MTWEVILFPFIFIFKFDLEGLITKEMLKVECKMLPIVFLFILNHDLAYDYVFHREYYSQAMNAGLSICLDRVKMSIFHRS